MKKLFYYYTPFGILTENQMNSKVKELKLDELEKDPFAGKLATVCLLKNNGDIARGISLMSKDDAFMINEGKFYAETKAIRVLKGRKIQGFGNGTIIPILISTRLPFEKPAELNPKLTMFEKKILKQPLILSVNSPFSTYLKTNIIDTGIEPLYTKEEIKRRSWA